MVATNARTRLAPKYPFPIPLDDCQAGWLWLQPRAATLGVDAARGAISGGSADGGLAASLAQRLHAAAGLQPIAQWLVCPSLDDRTTAQRALDAVDHFVWNNRRNAVGWRSYRSAEPGTADVPQDAAPPRPMRAAPDVDRRQRHRLLLRGEPRLRAAGVAVTLDVVPKATHGFYDWASDTTIARDVVARAQAWLRQALDEEPAAS